MDGFNALTYFLSFITGLIIGLVVALAVAERYRQRAQKAYKAGIQHGKNLSFVYSDKSAVPQVITGTVVPHAE